MSSNGTVVAIGAIKKDTANCAESGHVRVYERNAGTTTWEQKGADIDGEAANDWSGLSVSLSRSDGTVVAIEAYLNDGVNGAADSGHVPVYAWDGTNWNQLGTDIDGEAADDRSGSYVSLSDDGTVLAIGGIYNDGINGVDSGHVRVYAWDGTNWNQHGTDIDGEALDDRSGWSVSLSSDGTILAIGVYLNDGVHGADSGHVRV